jgi:hypothetical protein
LPALDSPYPLSEEQIAAYQRDGHVLLRGICAPNELAPYRDALTRMTNDYAKNYKPLAERDTYGKAFIQFTNLWQQDPAAARFTLAKRFAKIAADLMGVGGVRLYHDQALYKEAGGGHTPWHQDQFYWPLDGVKTVTMWMPLVDASADMGTMRFASGSQNLGLPGRGPDLGRKRSPVEPTHRRQGDADCVGRRDEGWRRHVPQRLDLARRARQRIPEHDARSHDHPRYLEDAPYHPTDHANNRENVCVARFPCPRSQPGDLAAREINPHVYSRED